MSFWKRLFGKSETKKPKLRPLTQRPTPAPAPKKEQFQPGHSREAARPFFHHVPDGWEPSNLTTTTNLLRIDALMTMAQYTGDGKDYEAGHEDLLMRKMVDDKGAFLIPLILTHKTTGMRHAAFFCYTEEDAAYFPYYAREMAKEPGWGASLYFGVTPYEDLPQGEDSPRPDSIGFVDLFQYDKDYQLPEGNYSLWNRTERESFMANSPLLPLLTDIYDQLEGYESFMAGLLMAGWMGQEYNGRMAMPEEEFSIGLKGPDHTPAVVSFSQQRGILISLPTATPPTYRYRLYAHFHQFVTDLLMMIKQRSDIEKDPEPAIGYPKKWFTALKQHLVGQNQGAHLIGLFQVGENIEPFSAEMVYDPESVPMEYVIPRIVYITDDQPETEGVNITTKADGTKATPYLTPYVGNLYIGYAVDRGDHFTYINTDTFEGLSPQDQEALPERALENIKEILRSGDGIGVAGSQEQGFFFLTGGDGNYEAATMLIDSFWEQVEPHVGGDLVIAVPSRSHLLITQLTNADGMNNIQEICEKIRGEIQPHRYYSDALYYRKPNGGWKVV